MPQYTEQFFDDLPDSVLISLNLFAYSTETNRAIKASQRDFIRNVDPNAHKQFCEAVYAAVDRRFGPVSGM